MLLLNLDTKYKKKEKDKKENKKRCEEGKNLRSVEEKKQFSFFFWQRDKQRETQNKF